ncbi:MAG TPA: alginate export family protein [Gemmatimonadales bacterium]|nr:alginate export family protein [Gemmatimonadales bacterium]
MSFPLSTFPRRSAAAGFAGRAAAVLGALAALAPAVPLAAQTAPGAPGAPGRPPAFQPLRFDEDWSAPPAAEALESDPLLRVKHIGFARAGDVYLSVGGHVRERAEAVRHFGLDATPGRNDGYLLSRVYAHGDLHLGSHLRVFVEGKRAAATSRTLPGSPRPTDVDHIDLQNAFADVTVGARAALQATARVGRQEMVVGRGRLVDIVDWANNRTIYQGARVRLAHGPLALDAFWVNPVTMRIDAGNARDTLARAWGVALGRGAGTVRNYEAYVIAWRGPRASTPQTSVHENRVTVGLRAKTPFAAGVALDGELGRQDGRAGTASIDAWFAALELTRPFPTVATTPVLVVGLDWATGDPNPADGVAQGFSTLVSTGHGFLGDADLLGRRNLLAPHVGVTARPAPPLALKAMLYDYRRVRTADGVYGKPGALFRAAGASTARHVGTELDLGASYRLGRHLKLDAGVSRFAPGAFLTETNPTTAALTWGYLGTTFTF